MAANDDGRRVTPPISGGAGAAGGGGARQLGVEMEVLDDQRLCVRVSGELDLATSTELEESLAGAISMARGVVLDLSGLSFMDSTGLAAIISALEQARASGVSFEFAEPLPAQPQRLLELTGVIERLSFTDTPART
jgi:anti-anti-sigma factor